MRMIPEVEMQIRRAIRDERAKDPLITIGKIQENLSKKFDRPFAYDYIMRMVHKVGKEAMIEASRTKLEARLNQTREQFRIMRDRLMQIIYWEPDQKLADMGIRQKPPYDEDVIAAVKTVATMELALMQAEVQAGIYRTLDDAREHHEPALLPTETRTNVIQAFNRWGFLPKGTVARLTERTIELHANDQPTAAAD
jgi:hypothetical protein